MNTQNTILEQIIKELEQKNADILLSKEKTTDEVLRELEDGK